MDREDEKKFTLAEYNWHIINNLKEFNNKPELIENMYQKAMQYLPEHTILLQFYDFYKTALEYYDKAFRYGISPDAEKYKQLGMVYEHLGDSVRATNYYKRAANFKPINIKGE